MQAALVAKVLNRFYVQAFHRTDFPYNLYVNIFCLSFVKIFSVYCFISKVPRIY